MTKYVMQKSSTRPNGWVLADKGQRNIMKLPKKMKKACKKYLVLGAALNTNALRYVHYQCNKMNKESKALAVYFYVRRLANVKDIYIWKS